MFILEGKKLPQKQGFCAIRVDFELKDLYSDLSGSLSDIILKIKNERCGRKSNTRNLNAGHKKVKMDYCKKWKYCQNKVFSDFTQPNWENIFSFLSAPIPVFTMVRKKKLVRLQFIALPINLQRSSVITQINNIY